MWKSGNNIPRNKHMEIFDCYSGVILPLECITKKPSSETPLSWSSFLMRGSGVKIVVEIASNVRQWLEFLACGCVDLGDQSSSLAISQLVARWPKATHMLLSALSLYAGVTGSIRGRNEPTGITLIKFSASLTTVCGPYSYAPYTIESSRGAEHHRPKTRSLQACHKLNT